MKLCNFSSYGDLLFPAPCLTAQELFSRFHPVKMSCQPRRSLQWIILLALTGCQLSITQDSTSTPISSTILMTSTTLGQSGGSTISPPNDAPLGRKGRLVIPLA